MFRLAGFEAGAPSEGTRMAELEEVLLGRCEAEQRKY
jgi:hypothetical protein